MRRLVACPYCRVPIDFLNCSMDHIVPVSRGGGLEVANLVPCCADCNLTKGSLTGKEFIDFLGFLNASFTEHARKDVLKRLKTGAGFVRLRFFKKAKPEGVRVQPHAQVTNGGSVLMITADQLLCHAIGDYILQSDWMATNKTKDSLAAFAHALCYSSLFWLLRPSVTAWLVIFGTHFLIDRFRLARYVVWAKNWIGPKQAWYHTADGWTNVDEGTDYRAGNWPTPPFSACSATGYPPTCPPWMAVWLLIIADNVLHVLINGLALKYL